MEKTRVQVKLDKDLVTQVDSIIAELGINRTALVNMLFKNVVREGEIPFDVKLSDEQRQQYTDSILDYADKTETLKLDSREKVDAWFNDELED